MSNKGTKYRVIMQEGGFARCEIINNSMSFSSYLERRALWENTGQETVREDPLAKYVMHLGDGG